MGGRNGRLLAGKEVAMRKIELDADDLVKKLDQFYIQMQLIHNHHRKNAVLTKGEDELYEILWSEWAALLLSLGAVGTGIQGKIGGDWAEDKNEGFGRKSIWDALE